VYNSPNNEDDDLTGVAHKEEEKKDEAEEEDDKKDEDKKEKKKKKRKPKQNAFSDGYMEDNEGSQQESNYKKESNASIHNSFKESESIQEMEDKIQEAKENEGLIKYDYD
jgi:hypothetical protein